MAENRICLSMNLVNHALSQYVGFNFNSMCSNRDKSFGFNEDGIFAIDEGGADGSGQTPIDAFVTFGSNGLGDSSQRKQLRKAYLNGTLEAKLSFDVSSDGQVAVSVSSEGPGNSRSVPLSRDMTGTDFEFTVRNVGGSDFDLMGIDIVAIPLGSTRVGK